MEWSRKRKPSKRSRENPLPAKPHKSLPREAFPDEFADLLHKGMLRRQTGILLLGSVPASPERELLLAETLRETQGIGPVGLVIPAYRFCGTDLVPQSMSSKRLPDLHIFGSVESAYASGCRRIALEYEREPYCPLPIELVVEYADAVCFIFSVDGVSCREAFDWATTSTWQDLNRLIGALCWSGFQGTRHAVALYDAFVTDERSVNADQYERPAEAVRDGRQLRWERQALRLLDSNQVTWRQLRHHLYTSGLIDPDLDFEAVDWSRTKEGLRDWLLDQLISLRRPTPSPPSATGRRFH